MGMSTIFKCSTNGCKIILEITEHKVKAILEKEARGKHWVLGSLKVHEKMIQFTLCPDCGTDFLITLPGDSYAKE
jgi:hypothetical protein